MNDRIRKHSNDNDHAYTTFMTLPFFLYSLFLLSRLFSQYPQSQLFLNLRDLHHWIFHNISTTRRQKYQNQLISWTQLISFLNVPHKVLF